MGVTPDKEDWSKKAVDIGRDLRKAVAQLHEFQQSVESVKRIIERLDEVQRQWVLKPDSAGRVYKDLQSNQVLELFGRLENEWSAVKSSVLELEESLLAKKVWLDNHRLHRTYSFESVSHIASFIQQAGEVYSIASWIYRPAFVGVLNTAQLEKETGVHKRDNASFVVLPDQVLPLLSALVQQKTGFAFRFEAPLLKLASTAGLNVRVEASNEMIRRLDHVAFAVNAKPIE